MAESAPIPTTSPGTEGAPRVGFRRPVNWSLWFGLPLVALTLLLTIFGPELAPRDPMERNPVVRVGSRFLNPPVPPFAAPGFPLGSDELGRDVLSRLLVGVRPTVVLVMLTALLRLALGLLVGIGAGWSHRWLGKALDTLTAGALALPLFIVALMVVIPLKNRWGVWAFVLALCLTGWGDTARLVREQVRALRGSAFIEAARALGGSDSQLIRTHVVRQLLPLMAILFAFEVSATLVTVAGLGFMGQFVGGEFLLPTDQSGAPSFAGQPELGQMLLLDLSTIFFGPWRVAASGGLVFLMVLGFNLLGDGLRWRFERGQPLTSRLAHLLTRATDILSARLRLPSGRLVWIGLLLVALLLIVMPRLRDRSGSEVYDPSIASGGTVQIGDQSLALAEGSFPPATLAVQPAAALWSSTLGDLHGARSLELPDPSAFAVLWSHPLDAPPTSGPVVDHDGQLYLALENGQALSLTAEGEERWRVPLRAAPVGSPAIGPDGYLYIADVSGGLTILGLEGQSITYQSIPEGQASVVGPLVGDDGTIYLALDDALIAQRAGELLWRAAIPPLRWADGAVRPPILSAEGELILYGTTILRRSDGSVVEHPLASRLAPTHLAVGGDGYNYMTGEGYTLRWAWDGKQIQPIEVRMWDPSLLEGVEVAETGATAGGTIWIVSSADQFVGARILWLAGGDEGPREQLLDDSRQGLVPLGSDRSGALYLCSASFNVGQCLTTVTDDFGMLQQRGPFSPPYRLSIRRATLVPNRIYVAASERGSTDVVLIAIE